MRVDGTDRPRVKRLEWLADKGMVLVELESKPEMPTVILLPREQVSAIIPLKSKPKEATKAKLPDETVSSSKSGELKTGPVEGMTYLEAAYKERGKSQPRAAGVGKYEVDTETGGIKEIKPKPKKRGRPKKKKG